MSVSRKILPGLVLLAILAFIISAYSQYRIQSNSVGLLTNQFLFSTPGPFQVGVRTLEISAEPFLKGMVWYPGVASTAANPISYNYEIKFQDPLGRITIADYPGAAFANAPFDLSMAPYPLVVLSPGFSIRPASYGWLAEHLASYGFVVISPDHLEVLDPEHDLWLAPIARPQDILTVFEYVDEQTGVGGLFEGVINPDLVAAAGHSFGGYTALAAAGAQIDPAQIELYCEEADTQAEPGAWLCSQLLPHLADMAMMAELEPDSVGLFPAVSDGRVDAVISMAGSALFFGEQSLSEINVPVMAIGGTADQDSPYMWSAHPTFEYASSSAKIKIALIGAEHMIFTGPCEEIPIYLLPFSGEFCSDSTWNRGDAHALIKHFTTAFLLAELKNDLTARSVLTPEDVDLANVDYEATGYGD